MQLWKFDFSSRGQETDDPWRATTLAWAENKDRADWRARRRLSNLHSECSADDFVRESAELIDEDDDD